MKVIFCHNNANSGYENMFSVPITRKSKSSYRFNKHKTYWTNLIPLFIITSMMLTSHSISAQITAASHAGISSDTNAVKKQRQGLFGFINHLFHKNSKSQNDYVRKNKNGRRDTGVSKKSQKPEPFEITKGGITWSSLYTQGVNLNTGISGLYSLARLSQGFDTYGLPFVAQGTGVFNNGQFERSYSSYSINFDVETYNANLRKRAENVLLNKKASGKTPNLADSLDTFESVRKKLQSPSCQSEESANKSAFQKEELNLSMHTGSDTTELHSLRMKLQAYEQLEKRYGQLYAIKRNAGNLEKADSSEKRYERDEKLLSNPDNVKKVLDESHQLSGYEKFLMGVKKFTIGQSGEEISEFTLHSFMMNGISTSYQADNIVTDVGYGKQIAVVDPFLMTGINVPQYKRTVEFVKSGEGPDNGSNFYATVIKIADPGGNNSIDETNWIMDLSKQIAFGKDILIEGEIAKSSFSYVRGRSDSAAIPFIPTNNNTIAYALRGKGIFPESKTVIKAEVSQTGGNYVTLGNPFLISGAKKYELDIIQPIGQKLSAGVGGTHILENRGTSGETNETDNWIHISIQYKPTNLISMELKYAPRQFQQESGTVYANSITSNINQLSFTGNMQSRIFGKNSTTSIFAGNFQYNTIESSQLFVQNLRLSYYMFSELLMLCPTQGINFSLDESRNDWIGSLSQFIGQATYNWNLKKSLTVALGPQWVEQPGLIANEAGVTGSLSSSIQKWGRIGLQFTYRNNAEKPLGTTAQYLINGNISILW